MVDEQEAGYCLRGENRRFKGEGYDEGPCWASKRPEGSYATQEQSMFRMQ